MAEVLKDSKVEWLGQIPADWKVERIGTLYSPRNTKVSDEDYPPLSVTMQGILPQLETVAKTDDHNNRKLVKKGDFAINSRSDRRGSCGISDYDGSVSLINTVLKPNARMNPIYYNWLFHTSLFADEFYKWGHGIVDDLWTTNWQDMKNIFVTIPPIDEQEKIAGFLDEKCAEIDKLSEDIQKQIDILNDYKKSVITRAVTKGLDPNAEMKDSGVQWIGKLPEKWTVIPVKYCFNIENGSDPKTDDGDTPVYGSGSKSFKKCVEFKKGPTVLLGRKGTVNIPQYITGNYWNVDTAFNTKPKGNYDLKLFYYAACSFDYENYSTQTALPSMTQSNYYNFRLPLMSQDEQERIVTFLDDKCSEIDESINFKQEQIAKLDTYKKSIIYEYVTGKKRVA